MRLSAGVSASILSRDGVLPSRPCDPPLETEDKEKEGLEQAPMLMTDIRADESPSSASLYISPITLLPFHPYNLDTRWTLHLKSIPIDSDRLVIVCTDRDAEIRPQTQWVKRIVDSLVSD
jgi:hypothetical protein